MQVPRTLNTHADALSKMALSRMFESGNIYTKILPQPSIEKEEILQLNEEPSWMDPIVRYLKDGVVSSDRKEARRLVAKAVNYIFNGQELYKWSFSWPLLKCLRPSDAELAMREVQEGISSDHSGGKVLAHKILRRVPYKPISNPVPFAMRGLDLLGPFPNSTKGHRMTYVAIDYFTKWVKAKVTDNGTQFASRRFKDFCGKLGIDQRFTSVGHPQANGQVKVTNRTLLQGLKKRAENARGLWAKELPNHLWAYRTTPRTATGESPFNLAFGVDAVIPVEIGVHSPRLEAYNEKANPNHLRSSLDLVEETRERARVRMAAYQHRVARYYNSRMKEE
ncbi:uncharacterized protein LOC143883228 [Tasmannia lanceolata]|uniref:uncharacterized protein LOC143883228 n=1 Tax=Tasmannia lanceolata TaxID=3420 RepID=UPI004064B61D